MKNDIVKSTGKKFENEIENIFLLFDKFSDNIFEKEFLNVYKYYEYIKMNNHIDFNQSIQDNENKILLFKNFPTGNALSEKTEFCIFNKIDNAIDKWRTECKFQKVSGSTNKKIGHEFSHYRDNKIASKETHFVLVYGGSFYEKRTDVIKDTLKSIQYDFEVLFLSVPQFKEFLTDYLNAESNISEVFKKHHAIIMKNL